MLCSHSSTLDCGCWMDDNDVVRRHAFRFVAGDRVHWQIYRGLLGTVTRGNCDGSHIVVQWDSGLASNLSIFPANFEIRHHEEV